MDNELYHHGVKGQKWGVRRFQNKDGSYTVTDKDGKTIGTIGDESNFQDDIPSEYIDGFESGANSVIEFLSKRGVIFENRGGVNE